ncbi:MAG: YqaE/Pmp3 family membrane protein [Myxococcota bacterium]
MNIVRLVLAILLPPVAAYLQVGTSKHFWINIVACFIGGLPGIAHAIWLVVTDYKEE